MREVKETLKKCRIYGMLKENKRHVSFHTPGHKYGKWDITELSYSDNLSNPSGVLKAAEEDISKETGAFGSFILTDGSTSGIMAMVRASGAKRILIPRHSHKSVYNAAEICGATLRIAENEERDGISRPLSLSRIARNISGCDAFLLTYPDYYGNLSDLKSIREICDRNGALLLIDGAHGSMFKGTPLYAGLYADMWVDGVHKNLPALTQGALVCCREEKFYSALKDAVGVFRTTSPNYIIMASVEFAEKYPGNEKIEKYAEEFKLKSGAYKNGDWSKAVFSFGDNAFKAEEFFERRGVYPEFCDGQNIMFYFSCVTKKREIDRLYALLKRCKVKFTSEKNKKTESGTLPHGKETEKIPLGESAGRVAAKACGLFPPCIPIICDGEEITPFIRDRLKEAANTYGTEDGLIEVYKKEGAKEK